MIELRIVPLGPARFGIRNVASPAVASRDDVWIAPPPSTVLGALGDLLGVRAECPQGVGSPTQAAEEALTALAEQLGIRRMWGPLVKIGDKVGIPAMDFAAFPDGSAKKFDKKTRIGLALTEQKAARPGHLYRATYLYPKNVVYIYYIDGLTVIKPTAVRLGGEGRSALIEAVETDFKLPERISGTAALMTPLLTPDGEMPPCLRPKGVLKLDAKECKAKLDERVKVVQWGLGFSDVCRERRPMYPALPPGTVAEAQDCPPTVGHMARLGYGALYPYNIQP
jgi:hypothetical protein